MMLEITFAQHVDLYETEDFFFYERLIQQQRPNASTDKKDRAKCKKESKKLQYTKVI